MAKVGINIATGGIQQEEIIVGIDLGTTNSLVAFINSNKEPYALNDMEGQTIVPSIVHFTSGGEAIVGNEAKKHLIDEPQHTVYSIKRLLGKSFSDLENIQQYFGYKILDEDAEGLVKIKIHDRYYTAIEISALILKELKSRAEHYLKTPVKRAVITVPAYFNDSQRQATRDAGKLAGLDVLRIVNEPTAASLAYGLGLDKNESQNIAVYDLGGGTFDISILRLQAGIFEVVSTNGNTFLGGDDFDKAIINYWIRENNRNIDEVLADKSLSQWLRLKAEEVKKQLSSNDTVSFSENGWELQISKEKFEELVATIVERSIICCEQAMADSGLTLDEISNVVMVGGSTRTPLVKKRVKEFFKGAHLYDNINPDEVVALGAAVEADILAGNRTDILLLDVTPLSLGIETLGGLMDTLIPRNSKVPSRAARQYTTSIDGQSNIKINVFQGERDMVSENRKLATFDLKGVPAMPAGLPKVEVGFQLNADGILTVTAKELRSGTSQVIEVKPQYGLTDEEVEKMLMDSLINARQDIDTRMLVEAKTEAQQLIYLTERFLEKNAGMLNEDEIAGTKVKIEILRDSLATNDRNIVLQSNESLNEFTAPFAERLMDMAISKAMKGKQI
jgi:molecular chaperone HscA